MISQRNASVPTVLFVCIANSCRSQMAEALSKSLSQERWEVWSAGSHPSGRVHPFAIQLMQEVGLSLDSHRSKGLGALPERTWDYVVTMGCQDDCPVVKARHRIAWEIPDPIGRPLDEARAVRNRIAELVRELFQSVGSKSVPHRD